MCNSKAEVCRRCDTHLLPAYLKALDAYYNSEIPQETLIKDVIAFATTRTGANEISAKINDSYTGTAMVNWLREGLTAGIAISVEERREFLRNKKSIKAQQKILQVDKIIDKIKEGKAITLEESNSLIAYGSTKEGLAQIILASDKANKKGFYLGEKVNQMVLKGKELARQEERIFDACKIECNRQHVGEVEHQQLINAYNYMLSTSHRLVTVENILRIASIIEPVKAKSFRRTPVTFANASMGLTPELIPNAMEALIENRDQLSIDEFVKEFLVIHPFQDGNGRTAFILYNMLNRRGTFPEELPDYFNEEQSNASKTFPF